MSKFEKSLWRDFLTFIGVIPITKPAESPPSCMRHGYPQEYLELCSASELEEIEKTSAKMQQILETL